MKQLDNNIYIEHKISQLLDLLFLLEILPNQSPLGGY